MQGESSSVESKAAAISGPGRYKCANCSRLFRTRRARGGHEIAHCKAREMSGKPYGPVLAAVLIHHIPSDDEEEEDEPAEAAANQEGTGSSQNPSKVVQTGNKAKGNESVTNRPKPKAAVKSAKPRAAKTGTSQRRPNKQLVPDQKSHHHQQKPEPQPQPLQLCTKDFLGEWNPICNITDGAETSNKPSEKNPLNPTARVFWEKSDDDLDLRLKLCSRNVEKLDLELKLGF